MELEERISSYPCKRSGNSVTGISSANTHIRLVKRLLKVRDELRRTNIEFMQLRQANLHLRGPAQADSIRADSPNHRARIAVTGNAMIESEVEYGTPPELTAEMIRAQLDLLVRDEVFRSSKRSVAFLRYVVEQTLNGSADQIKERTIGVEVFGRDPSYDTNLDHIVRTAATELRKRLATYYVDEKHRNELRMGLVPGSYIPRFTLPGQARHIGVEPETETEPGEAPLETHGAHIQFGPVPLAGSKKAWQEPARWWTHW